MLETSTPAPAIAYGADLPEQYLTPTRHDVKRRCVSGGFAAINPAPSKGRVTKQHPLPAQPHAVQQPRSAVDPLPGTRPTRILRGFWKPSSEVDARDRHAVYGVLCKNDTFRVKVVGETRDGCFAEDNFPSGAGAPWIPYEEVEFENHLSSLARQEVKEYCRIRQYQMDHGETAEGSIGNEAKAVYEAQDRVCAECKLAQPVNDIGRERAQYTKIYDGVMYERKPTGPFMGKLVSQGTIINVDGEDYVEYRVLAKPYSF